MASQQIEDHRAVGIVAVGFAEELEPLFGALRAGVEMDHSQSYHGFRALGIQNQDPLKGGFSLFMVP